MPNEDATERIAGALKKKLDAHGFSFQYAVVRYCEQLFSDQKSLWRFEVAEFPVEVKGAATKIDFVLHATSQYSDHGAYLVCECKRTNAAIADRAFVRAPYTHVSVGSLFGIGLTSRKADPRIVLGIVLSWLLTLPCAALLSAVIYWLAVRLTSNPA